jgi:multiple sugar transport system permease protein
VDLRGIVPLYWVLITSFKLPIQVDAGPFYLPFIDYRPTLDAWHYILVDIARDTIRPYVNSVVVRAGQHLPAVLVGAMAAYALVRIRFRVKIAAVASFVVLLLGVVVAVGYFDADWRLGAAIAIALFFLCLSTIARRSRRALTNGDIEFWMISNRIMPPVVAVLPIYLMFQKVHLLDTWTALVATYTAVNLPIVVWLTATSLPRSRAISRKVPRSTAHPNTGAVHHCPAARTLWSRRDVHARFHPVLERVSACALSIQR